MISPRGNRFPIQQLPDTGYHTDAQVLVSGQLLADEHLSCNRIVNDYIGKGEADIDSERKLGHGSIRSSHGIHRGAAPAASF